MNSPHSPESQSRIAVLRARAAEGSLSLDEVKEAVALLRADRHAAAQSSDQARRAKAKKAVKSADELLGELEGL